MVNVPRFEPRDPSGDGSKAVWVNLAVATIKSPTTTPEGTTVDLSSVFFHRDSKLPRYSEGTPPDPFKLCKEFIKALNVKNPWNYLSRAKPVLDSVQLRSEGWVPELADSIAEVTASHGWNPKATKNVINLLRGALNVHEIEKKQIANKLEGSRLESERNALVHQGKQDFSKFCDGIHELDWKERTTAMNNRLQAFMARRDALNAAAQESRREEMYARMKALELSRLRAQEAGRRKVPADIVERLNPREASKARRELLERKAKESANPERALRRAKRQTYENASAEESPTSTEQADTIIIKEATNADEDKSRTPFRFSANAVIPLKTVRFEDTLRSFNKQNSSTSTYEGSRGLGEAAPLNKF